MFVEKIEARKTLPFFPHPHHEVGSRNIYQSQNEGWKFVITRSGDFLPFGTHVCKSVMTSPQISGTHNWQQLVVPIQVILSKVQLVPTFWLCQIAEHTLQPNYFGTHNSLHPWHYSSRINICWPFTTFRICHPRKWPHSTQWLGQPAQMYTDLGDPSDEVNAGMPLNNDKARRKPKVLLLFF